MTPRLSSGQLRTTLTTLFIAASFTPPAWSWNEAGHRTIGEIARRLLERDAPKVLARVEHLLTIPMPEDSRLKSPSTTMEMAACWPDDLRRAHIKTYDTWHYLDIPYGIEGYDVSKVKVEQDGDVVTALNESVKVLRDPSATDEQKAHSLRFVLHCAGDIHQPLHCIGGFSAETPDGDKGGNLIKVRLGKRLVKLHALWDDGMGLFKGISRKNKKGVSRVVDTLLEGGLPALPPPHAWSREDFMGWAREGHALAGQVYGGVQSKGTLPDSYQERNRKLCQERALLAATRLAAVLRDSVKP